MKQLQICCINKKHCLVLSEQLVKTFTSMRALSYMHPTRITFSEICDIIKAQNL